MTYQEIIDEILELTGLKINEKTIRRYKKAGLLPDLYNVEAKDVIYLILKIYKLMAGNRYEVVKQALKPPRYWEDYNSCTREITTKYGNIVVGMLNTGNKSWSLSINGDEESFYEMNDEIIRFLTKDVEGYLQDIVSDKGFLYLRKNCNYFDDDNDYVEHGVCKIVTEKEGKDISCTKQWCPVLKKKESIEGV